jgi:hypothetical protein
MLLSFSHGDTGRRWSVLCGEMPARTMQTFTARYSWMLFVRLAAPGVVEPRRVHDGVGVRAASDNQQLRHDRAQPAAAGASSTRGGRCRTPGLRQAQVEGRSRSVRGIIWGCGLVRAGHVAVSYRHPKVGGHARLPRFHGCGAIACCVGRPGGPSRSRRGPLPAAAWALRVGRPAADRHIFGMAPSHGELLRARADR